MTTALDAPPHFIEEGTGSLAVLMLHGIGGGHSAFAGSLHRLSKAGYRVLSWDMPGYGVSPAVSPYDFPALAEAAIGMLKAAGVTRVVLVGHSMGGMVAQELFWQLRHRATKSANDPVVCGLVLAGTSAAFGKPGGDWQREFVAKRLAPLVAGTRMRELARTLVTEMVAPSADPGAIEVAISLMAAVPEATYRQALQALAGFDRRAGLAEIDVPTLLIAAEHDRNAAPAVMEEMARRIGGSHFIVMKECGHLMNIERPVEFDGLIVEFLRRHF